MHLLARVGVHPASRVASVSLLPAAGLSSGQLEPAQAAVSSSLEVGLGTVNTPRWPCPRGGRQQVNALGLSSWLLCQLLGAPCRVQPCPFDSDSENESLPGLSSSPLPSLHPLTCVFRHRLLNTSRRLSVWETPQIRCYIRC